MYVCIANIDNDYYLLHDRPVLSTGRKPHDKQKLSCLDYSQNLVMSPTGAQRQDWLTDRPTVSSKITSDSDSANTSHPISLIFILISFSHLRLRITSGLFLTGFPTKIVYAFLSSHMHLICRYYPTLLDFISLIIFHNQ